MDRTQAFPGQAVVCRTPPNKGKMGIVFEPLLNPPGGEIIRVRLTDEQKPNGGEVVEGGLADFDLVEPSPQAPKPHDGS